MQITPFKYETQSIIQRQLIETADIFSERQQRYLASAHGRSNPVPVIVNQTVPVLYRKPSLN